MGDEITKSTPLSLDLGNIVGRDDTSVAFGEQELSTHMAVYGGTGKGKSKLLELLIRQILQQRAGVCVIDPHGDLVEDLLLFYLDQKTTGFDGIADHVQYFEPGSSEFRFAFDPFQYTPVPGESYEDWLRAKVESVARVIIRKQGEGGFEGKPRLERFLTNVLYAAGVSVDAAGTHLGLADAWILLDTSHALHKSVYAKIAPYLPSDIKADFNKVFSSKPREQENWVESTINRLRSFLSPAVRSLFSPGVAETLNFRSLIEKQALLLVNLRRTRSFTLDQGSAMGGLFINEIIEAAQIAERNSRRPFYLIIDEASRFVGHDIIAALAQCRKWKLSICLAVQDLSSLKTNEVDMTAKVLSQCGIHISFQQKHPDDLELLGQLFGYPLLDFTPLAHEVDRFDGYEEVHTTDYTSTKSASETNQKSESKSQQYKAFEKEKESYSRTEGRSASETAGRSESVASKTSFRTNYRQEIQQTGRLQKSVTDQFHEYKKTIRELAQGQAAVAVDGNKPFVLNVRNVQSSFSRLEEEERNTLVNRFKRYLGQVQPYAFEPALATDELTRLAEFVGPNTADPASTEDTSDFGI